MSENKRSDKKKGGSSGTQASAVAATAIVALLAVAAIVVLFVMPKSKSDSGETRLPDGTVVTFKPTQELVDECGAMAQELVRQNYLVVRLFVSEGLQYKPEPYGNHPEGGYYTADSDDYKIYGDIEKLVKAVYVPQEAERILTKMPADPEAAFGGAGNAPEHIAIYGSREIYVSPEEAAAYDPDRAESEPASQPQVPDVYVPDPDEASEPAGPLSVKVTALGINENFKPYYGYDRPWGSTIVKILPLNENECSVTVYLGANKDVDLSSIEDKDILTVTMVRENSEWRLTKLIY